MKTDYKSIRPSPEGYSIMKTCKGFFLSGIRLSWSLEKGVRYVMLILLFSSLTFSASAQTITWTDYFTKGLAPSPSQCENWTIFLNQLDNRSFVSVTISGTFMEDEISITDAAAATELAGLLSTNTEGAVVSGDHTWRVTLCGSSVCEEGELGLELTVDGNGCDCDDRYVIRPYAENTYWGGLNTGTCEGIAEPMKSQNMQVTFNTGVAITASGPTSLCEEKSVVLTASSTVCAGSLTYLWSNNETTESITVTQAGDYSVTVYGSGDCTGTSPVTSVTVNTATVDAGEDVTTCEEGIQLNAIGNKNSPPVLPVVNEFCLYDVPGGPGNCNFSGDLCLQGFDIVKSSNLFSKSGGIPEDIQNPIELRFKLYYAVASGTSTFTYKLNGNIIGSHMDSKQGSCSPAPAGPVFIKNEFIQFWDSAEANELTVEIVSSGEVYVYGLAYEVVTHNELYSWSPAAGLSDPTIQNPVATPETSTTYTVNYTAANGCSATDEIKVNVECNTAPVANCKPLIISAENNCEASADAVDFNDNSTSEDGGELTYRVFPEGPYSFGITDVTLTVTDVNGESSTCSTTITVTDTELPTIATLEDLSIFNDPGVCSATVSLPEPETADNCEVETVSHDQTDAFPLGETIVTWTVTDIHGNSNSTIQKVIVTNTDPVITSVTVSNSVEAINTPVLLTASYEDNNVISATIDWDDLSGLQTVTNPEDIFNVSHTYNASGFYSPVITITDACEATATYVYDYIVVYDRDGGFVTGGGWFNSPAGSYTRSPASTGKASFNFVSKYKKKGTSPEGNADFEFKSGDLKFKSQEYQWLVVNERTAVLQSSGKVNGASGYEMLISMVDDDDSDHDDRDRDKDKKSDKKDKDKNKKDKKSSKHSKKSRKSDKIRVKIWDAYGVVIYDSQVGSPDDAEAETKLGGGSIQIHKGKSNNSIDSYKNTFAYSHNVTEASTEAYPNPFTESVKVKYYASFKDNVSLQLMDIISGKVVYDKSHPFSEDGLYTVILPDSQRGKGIYLLKISQGMRVETLKLLRE